MERRVITIRGVVQGVGFRPFVHGLATRLSLSGFVKNQSGEVLIEVEGEEAALDEFVAAVAGNPPPRATIERLDWRVRPLKGERRFRIDVSDSECAGAVFISPDITTCEACVRELFDPSDRRFRYPFVNCTNCGPRLTIITGAPYDRERTTMADFAMCAACRKEYDDPTDRRFHAQPIACPACGPRLMLCDSSGREMVADNALRESARLLSDGQIAALKGLGGYHLACDAGDRRAVAELRRRKHRDEKPFAIMVRDLPAARRFGAVTAHEAELLLAPQRPIVLLRRRADFPTSAIAADVAPGNPNLGIMLPYTPLHHLLMAEMGDRPLVMTSGNRSDEPIAYDDADALARLADIADVFLQHTRPIHVRCDDSVMQVRGGASAAIRRSRGYAPGPIALPFACGQPILAVGGQLKSTFALGRDSSAFVSHHLGDLDHYEAVKSFRKDIRLYEELLGCIPQVVAHDSHPDYASTRYGQERGLRAVPVQHHHAHLASCMAENGLNGPVIGVIFDGAGYGSDGAIWGGEFLIGDYRSFRRAAHLRYVGMAGGERATREPWRMALAYLRDCEASLAILEERIPTNVLRNCVTMLERGINSPRTSSVGRLFDAIASLVGLRDRVSHEGQAAMELEWLATDISDTGIYAFDVIEENDILVIDPRPMIRQIVSEIEAKIPAAVIGSRFHTSCSAMIATVCGRLRSMFGIDRVVLSGGVFSNELLTADAKQRLEASGLTVHCHRVVPPGDGGLSLGQLAVAAHVL